MSKQSVKQKLQLIGCEIIEENDFGIIYQKNGLDKLGLVLCDSEDNTKSIDIDSFELNNYFIITEESFGVANGLYVKDSFNNLLCPTFKRELYTYDHLLTHRARLHDTDRVILIKPIISSNTYTLVNYRGSFMTITLDADFIQHGDVILRRDTRNDNLTIRFVTTSKSIKLVNIDFNFKEVKVLNKSMVSRVIRTQPDYEVLYKRRFI